MTSVAAGGVGTSGLPLLDISDAELDALFSDALAAALAEVHGSGPVLIIPPDITRIHSRAGFLTGGAARELGAGGPADRLGAVLPALGTHMAQTDEELRRMFPATPLDKFRVHDWRTGVVELGRIDAAWIEQVSEGNARFDWPVQVNKLLRDGGFSLIVSIGQVVPHEVVGMANHAKNLLVGTGGKEAIDKSHFVGASYGMERMMGRADTPVRAMFDEGLRRFGGQLPPVLYVLTVIGPRNDAEVRSQVQSPTAGPTAVRGLFIGFGRECFEQAAALSRELNVDLLDEPVNKAVVYLEPGEFRTTWLGNKAIYRTRMALADGGELLILAPGLERFGEDRGMDALIRAYGYRPRGAILEAAARDTALAENLSAAAHLIHGSSEGRFTVRYCPGPGLTRAEIESVGYEWGSLDEALARYDPAALSTGWNTRPGVVAGGAGVERIFYVPNPALGLWAERRRFLTDNR
jgi:nickel-dependent lactate racemase